jgi:hypothetical protein
MADVALVRDAHHQRSRARTCRRHVQTDAIKRATTGAATTTKNHSHAPEGFRRQLGKSDQADRALARYAAAYADQNDRDYKVLRESVASGCLTARYDF